LKGHASLIRHMMLKAG